PHNFAKCVCRSVEDDCQFPPPGQLETVFALCARSASSRRSKSPRGRLRWWKWLLAWCFRRDCSTRLAKLQALPCLIGENALTELAATGANWPKCLGEFREAEF